MESDSLTADGKGQPDTRAASPLDVAQVKPDCRYLGGTIYSFGRYAFV